MMETSITSGQREAGIRVTVDAFRKVFESEFNRLVEADVINRHNFQGILAQGDVLVKHVASTTKSKMLELVNYEDGYLKRVSPTEGLIIEPSDGGRGFARAQDIFPAYLDTRLESIVSCPTERVVVDVFNIQANVSFQQRFGRFGQNLDRLCLEPSQVVYFVRNHSHWLSGEGDGTMFLIKFEGQIVVATVGRRVGKFGVCMHERVDCWNEYFKRVVVPKM